MRGRLRIFLPLLVLAFIAATWLGAPVTYMEISAPDGTGEILSARYARFRSFISVFPGQGGDHPGILTLQGPAGQTCGKMSVPMVNLITSVRWQPRVVSLPPGMEIRRCVVREGL